MVASTVWSGRGDRIASVVLRPPLVARVAALMLVVLTFIAFRHFVEDRIQERLLMATDIGQASVRDIRKGECSWVSVRPYQVGAGDRGATGYFVDTVTAGA